MSRLRPLICVCVLASAALAPCCVLRQLCAADAESGTILVSLIDRPVGRETYSIRAGGDGLTFTADLDLTERGGRLQVASSLRTGAGSDADRIQRQGKVISLR